MIKTIIPCTVVGNEMILVSLAKNRVNRNPQFLPVLIP